MRKTVIAASAALLIMAGVGMYRSGNPLAEDDAIAARPVGPTSPSAATPSGGGRQVAIELFTSQGCSSCPPADVLLEKLAKEPGVVTITRPVTYWDGLGWKDTLAMPSNTNLQRAYGARHLPGGGVYTPEAVVQGSYGAVGSDERRIRALIAQARAATGPSVAISGNQVNLSGNGNGTIQLVRLRPQATVQIGDGENSGRQVRYTDVLVSEQSLGSWSGGPAHFTLPSDARSAGHAAVLVRQGTAGPILAITRL